MVLYINTVRYHTPWGVMSSKLRRSTVTLAGDSMHLMGPSLHRTRMFGCVRRLEDGVVLARCLWRKLGQESMNN
ncbi:unnamed protein product [Cochlearia groenlandica]